MSATCSPAIFSTRKSGGYTDKHDAVPRAAEDGGHQRAREPGADDDDVGFADRRRCAGMCLIGPV
jgi:hypothetical protein